nr:MAG TPA: hypothetical protein [Caudoviricetes sp.]
MAPFFRAKPVKIGQKMGWGHRQKKLDKMVDRR